MEVVYDMSGEFFCGVKCLFALLSSTCPDWFPFFSPLFSAVGLHCLCLRTRRPSAPMYLHVGHLCVFVAFVVCGS